LGKIQEADAAFQTAFAKSESAPESIRNRIRWVYAFAISARLPEKAREIFDVILKDDPSHPQALYGRGMLAVEQGKTDEGIQYFEKALEAFPGFIDARRARAILWARQQRFDLAMQDINWCLEKEPRGGATLYGAACVAALAAPTDPAAANQAINLLQKAFQAGYGQDKAAKDPDLKWVHTNPMFTQLLSAQKSKG